MSDRGTFEHQERGSHELSSSDCRRLLATRTLGRVGLTSGALPVILPVEYCYEEDVITFSTAHDEKLRAAADGHVLAFEVDAYDAESASRWSVHVLGRATVVADGGAEPLTLLEAERAERWPGHLVRLQCEIVEGHLLAHSCI
jgi:nitroimidazol reductase NimA-like FMN-containing flavoprotein (pyridoxamine 5'-phosphate oxidase superfamily)